MLAGYLANDAGQNFGPPPVGMALIVQRGRLMVRELGHTQSLTVSNLALASMKARVALT
jgi:hypothetical protein